MVDPGRRALLASVGSAIPVLVAGCADDLDGREAGETPTDGSNPAASPSRPTDGTPVATAAPGTHDVPPMVRIDGGTYTIGTDDGPGDARPAHEVDLAPFAIDRYEVTNARYATFLNALDVTPTGDASPGAAMREDFPAEVAHLFVEGPEGEEDRPLVALDDGNSRIGVRDGRFVVQSGYGDHPVNEVTWRGARRYARWRGARLPTEAEWEAAARGVEGRTYPWGDSAPTHEKAVFGQGSGETAPVGSHPEGATPDGIHDMAGNVSEWTNSLYWPYPYAGDDGREDPTVNGERVTRGGAHVFFGPEELRAYHRTGFSREVDRGHRHIGFRCVRSLADG